MLLNSSDSQHIAHTARIFYGGLESKDFGVKSVVLLFMFDVTRTFLANAQELKEILTKQRFEM
jgi:hypothetical protein